MSSMNQSPLVRDIRRLRRKTLRQDQIKDLQDELCSYLTALIPPYETCDELIGRRVLHELVTLDIPRSAVILKHPFIEPFLDEIWKKGKPVRSESYYYPDLSRWRRWISAGWRYFENCTVCPRLIWASHASRNVLFFVLLTVFVFSPDLLSQYPLPIEWALLITFIVPSLFPPYNVTFPGYLTIAILFLISFIFRGIAFQNWPYVTPEVVDLLLNSRTILSFLPLIQLFNVVLLTFHLPRLAILRRLLDPAVPIAIILFVGFFLSLHILSDTHSSVRHTFDILLRTLLLDVRPGNLTEFHPVAARIVYFLFAFLSLYLFWGIGIAGVGMRVVHETDWDAERIRWKMLRLLKFLPDRKCVAKRGVFGRGNVLAAMPFNVIEGFGWAFRSRYLIIIPFYLGIAPTVLAWTVGRAVWSLEKVVRCLMRKTGGFLFDEWDNENVGQFAQGDGGGAETSRLLS